MERDPLRQKIKDLLWKRGVDRRVDWTPISTLPVDFTGPRGADWTPINKRDFRRRIACGCTLALADRIVNASNPQEPVHPALSGRRSVCAPSSVSDFGEIFG